jgi:hypothetical protein
MKNTLNVLGIIVLFAIIEFQSTLCFGQSNNVKEINNANELKEYLDKQPANNPDIPIKVAININDVLLNSFCTVIKNTDKYVSIDLSGSQLKNIPRDAFYNCKNLTNVILPNGITSIGNEAFRKCTSLVSITIPESVTSTGSFIFRECSNLTNVTLPESITIIGEGFFVECISLSSITLPNIRDFADFTELQS